MSRVSEAIRPREAPAADQALAPAAPRWPAAAVLASWTLVGLGISAHDGEWSAWGLAALLAAFVLLIAVAASGRPLAPPGRGALGAALAVCLLAAVVHPAYRLMHVRGA